MLAAAMQLELEGRRDRGYARTARERGVMKLFEMFEYVTSADVAAALKLTRNNAVTLLARMVARRLVVRCVGPRPHRYVAA